MADILERLKEEHQLMLKNLHDLEKVNIITPEGHQKVLSLKDFFMTHLQEEDNDFYPVLKEAAQKDSRLEGILDLFDENMKEISDFAFEFFNKYLKGAIEFEFRQDFQKLYATLKTRILREEEVLHAEFAKIKGKGA